MKEKTKNQPELPKPKKAKESLIEKEESLWALLNATTESALLVDLDGTMLTLNETAAKRFGKHPKELIGLGLFDYLPPDLAKSRKVHGDEVIRTKKPVRFQDEREGMFFEIHIYPVFDKKGNVKALAIYARDVTEARKYEEALQESEEKYRSIFESLQDVYYRTDGEGRVTIISPSVRAQAGYNPEDIIGHQVTDFYLNPSDREIFKTRIKELGVINDYELQLKAKDGSVIEVSTSSKIIYGEDGSPVGVEGVMRYITERKRAEEALQESEERFKILFEYAPDAYYLSDQKGILIDGNLSAEDMLGYKRSELVGKSFLKLKLLSAKEVAKAAKLLVKNVLGKATGPDEFILRRKDGTTVSAEIRTYPVQIKEQTLILGIARDITKRKQAEDELHESEERFRNLMEQSPVAIQIFTPDGRTVSVNTAYKKLWGLSEEVLSQLYEKFNVLQDEQSRKLGIMPLFEKAFAGEAVILPPIEYDALETMKALDFTKAKGEKRWIQIRLYPVKNENGEIMNVVLMLENITERKKAEEALQKREAHQALVLSSLPMAFYTAYPYGDYGGTWVSSQIHKIGGYTSDQFREDPHLWASKLHPEDRDQVIAEFDSLPDKGSITVEYRWQTADGQYIWILDQAVIVRDEKNEPKEIIGTWLDITERKHEAEKLEESYKKLQKAISGNIQLMATTVEIRDPYTAGHQRRVADLARAIATEMALPKDQVEGIYMAGVIHDLGKISVPSEILSKPGKLKEMEFNLIKTHPRVGFDILKEIEFPWPIAQIVYQHHERMDGLGYPQGLSGEKILLEARIMCVADVVEAMASHRPYRSALGIDVALWEIKKNKGKLYDPDVADACLNLFAENKFKFTD